MASFTPCVMDSDELGFTTKILVEWRRTMVVMLTGLCRGLGVSVSQLEMNSPSVVHGEVTAYMFISQNDVPCGKWRTRNVEAGSTM